MGITYGPCKIRCTMHFPFRYFQNALAYFTVAVRFTHKVYEIDADYFNTALLH
jgi:hypothetical protein